VRVAPPPRHVRAAFPGGPGASILACMTANTFAARAGRWSAANRKKAIFGWLAFVIAAVAIGSAVGTKTPTNQDSTVGDSGRGDTLVSNHYPDSTGESVLIQIPSTRSGQGHRDADVRAAVAQTVKAVSGFDAVQNVKSPFSAGHRNQISPDGRSVLVNFEVKGDENARSDAIDPIEAAVKQVAAAHPDLRVGEFGGASADKAISKAFADDFSKAEKLSIPITIAILILAFGTLAAVGIPILLALTAVFATLGILGPVSHLISLDENVSSVVLLIGMAVGVDYTLFYLKREREERRAGASEREAIHTAAATSGRAVLVSGLTVIVAMAGMFFAGDKTFTGMGVGSILVVAMAMIGSVTVLPALLSKLGDKVDRAKVPFIGRRAGGESRAWAWVLDRVLRRPLVSALASGALLVALAIPALGMHTANSGIDSLPRKLEVMKVYDRMQAAFPGNQIPATVVVHADDVRTPRIQAALADLKARALATGHMGEPVSFDMSPDHQVGQLSIPIRGNGNDAASQRAVDDLRNTIVPATVGRLGHVDAFVTGYTAGSRDWNDLMRSRAPIVFAFVLTLAFLLLLVTFRSIVIPIKAIVLNLLSVGAAYGVLVEVFQKGHGASLLGFKSQGFVTAWLPMFLFVVLFGLSMDYHVFILSRVREAFDRGMKTEDAVAHGIKSTAGVVTSAAAVMVAVFAIFATLSAIDFKMMGVGLATAILIDATVVRAVLLPATMKLLGDWNWYLPSKLDWLPRVGGEHAPDRAAARAATA
jgi:putative drug exporter of the RND superfamily